MRRITKLSPPDELRENAAKWQAEYEADPASESKRVKYRHPAVKQRLREETHWKCIYCECKVGHNTPGDVEHIAPSSKRRDLHFVWTNLTIACNECNRRKLDYYDIALPFVNPYEDPIEDMIVILGPFVWWKPGNQRAEVSLRCLELHSTARAALLQRKLDTLEKARSLLDAAAPANAVLAALRLDELKRMQRADAEFSAVVSAFVAAASSSAKP